MKSLISCCLLFLSLSVSAQVNVNQVLNSVTGSGSGLGNDKIVKGLKEALTIGANNSAASASKLDGFYKNTKIKIPMPPEARELDKTVRKLGMSKQADDFIKSMNRAAEDASKKAAPIFVNAITKMNINDGLSILKGGDDAATQYLKKATTSDLKKEFNPIIKSSLNKAHVAKYWNTLAKSYNKVPFVQKVNPDLEDYVSTKAIDGLFKLIGEEEKKIRKDPAKQVTDILKQVFGGNP